MNDLTEVQLAIIEDALIDRRVRLKHKIKRLECDRRCSPETIQFRIDGFQSLIDEIQVILNKIESVKPKR